MTTFAKLALVATAAIVLTTSFAQAGNGGIIVNKLPIKPVAACQFASGEFPNDIFITNKGPALLKSGAKVAWSVPFANATGTYTLVADLAVGKSVFVADVIPGSVEAGHPCSAQVK